MRRITILRFLMLWIVGVSIVLVAGMALMNHILTNNAIDDAVYRQLAKEAGRASRKIEIINDQPVISGNYQQQIDKCYLTVMDADGEYLSGEYPKEWSFLITTPINVKHRLSKVRQDGEHFYIYDRKAHINAYSSKDGDYILRVGINVKDTDTIYSTIRDWFYCLLAIFILVLVVIVICMNKVIGRPMKDMCENAKRITMERDHYELIEENGFFYETEVLIKAYNSLLERTNYLIAQQESFNENVAHELKTPIAVIRSECELIEDLFAKELPEEVRNSVSVIERQTGRVRTMIMELMHLSRIDRGEYEFSPELVDLTDIAEVVCEDAEDMAQGKRIFVYDLQPAEAFVDVSLIMVVVRNLISNAIKYSREGSNIYVSTGIDGGWAWLTVRDEGIGISKEEQKKIFDYYYQVDDVRNSDGFGLGLTLSRKIAKRHNGEIRMSSEPGKGSTFTLILPRDRKEEDLD